MQLEGLSGLWTAWPRPSLEAWSYVAGHGLLQAALQLGLPGRTHLGPVTPKGNVPVYKVCHPHQRRRNSQMNHIRGSALHLLRSVLLRDSLFLQACEILRMLHTLFSHSVFADGIAGKRAAGLLYDTRAVLGWLEVCQPLPCGRVVCNAQRCTNDTYAVLAGCTGSTQPVSTTYSLRSLRP